MRINLYFVNLLLSLALAVSVLFFYPVSASSVDAVYVTDTGAGSLESSYTPSKTFPWLNEVRLHLSGTSDASDKFHVFFVSGDGSIQTSLLYPPTSLTDVQGYNTASMVADVRVSFNPPVYVGRSDSIGIQYDNTNDRTWGLSLLFRR